MCAVVGLQSKNFIDKSLVKEILLKSMIRGKHATGLSWIESGKLKHEIVPCSADLFDLPDFKTKNLIAHCRYSTSDLLYNQPVYKGTTSLAHNGVVDQSDPSEWEAKYNMKFSSKCDSEILLLHWLKGIHPLNIEGSMSCVVLTNKKSPSLNFFRNEQRPLYFSKQEETLIVGSTKNILERCGIADYEKTEPCLDYCAEKTVLKVTKIRDPLEDLQA